MLGRSSRRMSNREIVAGRNIHFSREDRGRQSIVLGNACLSSSSSHCLYPLYSARYEGSTMPCCGQEIWLLMRSLWFVLLRGGLRRVAKVCNPRGNNKYLRRTNLNGLVGQKTEESTVDSQSAAASYSEHWTNQKKPSLKVTCSRALHSITSSLLFLLFFSKLQRNDKPPERTNNVNPSTSPHIQPFADRHEAAQLGILTTGA